MFKFLVLKLVLLFILVFGSVHSFSQEKGNSSKKDMDIYLLIGQSNMAGRAEVEGSDADTLKHVFLYTGIPGKEWEKAANPLNKYSSIRKKLSMQRLGPGYHFAKKMAQLKPDKKIGLVVNAKGGTKIEEWMPGTEFYTEAIRRTKAALKYGVLKGIVWHQGEGNASKYQEYMPKITELIAALRNDFGQPDLPFVAGQLSKDKPQRKKFNRMILKLPKKMKNCGVVRTKKTSTIDNTHFNAASQKIMGERYAEEMLRLIQEQNNYNK